MTLLQFWEMLLPILAIAIPVFATIYTVNSRIKNENKENHKPYLSIHKVESLRVLDRDRYYLTMIGRNYRALNESLTVEEIEKLDNDNDICVNLLIQNIGYGVATNIKFYNLLTGRQIHGTQASNKEKNQKLFTTFDIASNTEKDVQARIISSIKEVEGTILEDHNRILCVYQDLNRNKYDMIISINVKTDHHYDFFSYQPSSQSYQRWIKENKKQYRKISKEYDKYNYKVF